MAAGNLYVSEKDPNMVISSLVYCSVYKLTYQSLEDLPEDFGRRPRHPSGIGVDAVNHQLSTTADVVDCIFENGNTAGSLDDDVESVGILLFYFFELGACELLSGLFEPSSFKVSNAA